MTNKRKVYQVDVFTKEIDKGNPAGVVPDADDLTDEQMQKIATEMNFNETVFIRSSEKADVALRYYTPGYETPLCGHATLGAVHYLYEQGKLGDLVTIETQVGVLTIQINGEEITMEQGQPKATPFGSSKEELCHVLGIEMTDLVDDLPIEYGNTGSWTLLVPVKDEAVLAKMQPKSQKFPDVLREVPRSSIHPFAIIDQAQHLWSARHFSSPFSATIEDAVTGTASGVMAAYAQKYLYPEDKVKLTITQGKYMGREGVANAYAEVVDHNVKIKISGKAVCNPEVYQVTL